MDSGKKQWGDGRKFNLYLKHKKATKATLGLADVVGLWARMSGSLPPGRQLHIPFAWMVAAPRSVWLSVIYLHQHPDLILMENVC